MTSEPQAETTEIWNGERWWKSENVAAITTELQDTVIAPALTAMKTQLQDYMSKLVREEPLDEPLTVTPSYYDISAFWTYVGELRPASWLDPSTIEGLNVRNTSTSDALVVVPPACLSWKRFHAYYYEVHFDGGSTADIGLYLDIDAAAETNKPTGPRLPPYSAQTQTSSAVSIRNEP